MTMEGDRGNGGEGGIFKFYRMSQLVVVNMQLQNLNFIVLSL